jgi:hypothetical protein
MGAAEVMRPVDCRTSGRTPKLGNRELAGVRAEPHRVYQPRGHRRHHETRTRHVDDDIDIEFVQAGIVQCPLDRLWNTSLSMLLIDPVADLETGMLQRLLDWSDDVPLTHSGIPNKSKGEWQPGITSMEPAGDL